MISKDSNPCPWHFPLRFARLFLTSFLNSHTVFENHRKSRIQHCERSELRLHWWKMPKIVNFVKSLKACSLQTVLPDRSLLIGKKWWIMPKLKISNATFWVIFKQCVSASSVLKIKVEFDDKTLLHIEWPATFLTFVFTPTVFEIHTKMSQLKNYVKMRLV